MQEICRISVSQQNTSTLTSHGAGAETTFSNPIKSITGHQVHESQNITIQMPTLHRNVLKLAQTLSALDEGALQSRKWVPYSLDPGVPEKWRPTTETNGGLLLSALQPRPWGPREVAPYKRPTVVYCKSVCRFYLKKMEERKVPQKRDTNKTGCS